MNEALWIGLGSLVTAVLGGIVTAIVTLMNAVHRNRREDEDAVHRKRREDEDSVNARQNAHIERLEKEIDRQGRLIQEQQKSFNQMQELHSQCREDFVACQAAMEFLDEERTRFHAILARRDPSIEPLRPMPRLPNRHSSEDAEFLSRTMAQNATLVKKLDQQVTSQREGEKV
jgi:Mg2+ and Co2+ transporter CorA